MIGNEDNLIVSKDILKNIDTKDKDLINIIVDELIAPNKGINNDNSYNVISPSIEVLKYIALKKGNLKFDDNNTIYSKVLTELKKLENSTFSSNAYAQAFIARHELEAKKAALDGIYLFSKKNKQSGNLPENVSRKIFDNILSNYSIKKDDY